MKNISLNFYGEEVLIECPKDYVSLKKQIAMQYQLSLSDILEIDISYMKNEQKKLIKSEIDFKTFLHSRVPKLNLDIKESSQLYQKSLLDLQNKAKDDLVQLEMLKKQKEENKKKQEKENEETKNKIDDLNKQIKEIGQQKLEYVKSIKKMMRGPRNKEKELVTKITQLGNEIGAPLVFKLPEKGPLPIKGETEKEKKLLDLIKKNTDCLNVQKQLYVTPRKNMKDMDKQIKEINKKCLGIIKVSQKEMMALKKEENDLIRQIISLEKKLGLNVDEKKPMKKFGFYIPKKVDIKTVPKEGQEETLKLKAPNTKPKAELIIPKFPSKKSERMKSVEEVFNSLKTNIKSTVEQEITKAYNEIKKVREEAKKNNYELKAEDKKYLEKCEKDNSKAIAKVDEWIEFIYNHTDEIIESLEAQNKTNFKKFDEIEKRIGRESSTNLCGNNPEKKMVVHPGVFCSGCKQAIVGIRYKCAVCKDFDFCEKCEEKSQGKHGHPFLKINRPDLCPIEIKCSLRKEQ